MSGHKLSAADRAQLRTKIQEMESGRVYVYIDDVSRDERTVSVSRALCGVWCCLTCHATKPADCSYIEMAEDAYEAIRVPATVRGGEG